MQPFNHPLSSFSWETGQPVAARRQLDVEETGPAVELAFQETDSGGPVLVYGTSYGDIVGWDLRISVVPIPIFMTIGCVQL